MKIVKAYPPNIETIRAKFTLRPTVIFTYGDTIYNPIGGKITEDLMVHEQTHEKQQGDDPAGWWDKYLVDADFRLSQEVEAYRNQYQCYLETKCIKNGKLRRVRLSKFLKKISTDLASPIYGNIVTVKEARELIADFSN